MKTIISTDKAPGAIGPYSQGIDLGSILFCSGQIPLDPVTGTMPEGITAQTEQALQNVEALLASRGLTLANVVKTTVFLANMAHFAEMNAVYAKHFTEPYPARSAVAVRELPKGALVEVEVIAAR